MSPSSQLPREKSNDERLAEQAEFERLSSKEKNNEKLSGSEQQTLSYLRNLRKPHKSCHYKRI